MKNTENFDPNKVRKAVIIADTFTNLLNPINVELPDVLLPICNIPVIEYMIDFLFSNSIKEIIIVSKRCPNILSKYINKHYKKNKSIKLITSEDFTDMGDCLRKIYSEKLIITDFVLIRGLVIANFNLEKVFDYHMQRKKEDKNCILTSIFKKYKNDKFIKTKYDQNVLIYDVKNNQVLQYESLNNNTKIKLNENLKFNLPKPKNTNEIPIANRYRVRTDFYDSFIDICSVDVLNHFSENFDYHSIRDDLYRNVINSEIYIDQFYFYEISEDDYVGVIKNFETYQKVSYEIINRWAHPVVLEHLLLSSKLDINYKTMHSNIYLDGESNIKGRISDSTVVGSGCHIEEGTKISTCVIGKNSKIGKNSRLKKCIILSDSTIGENVSLENTIIGNNTIISSNSIITNSYIGHNLKIPEGEYTNQRIRHDLYEDESDSLEYIEHETFYKNLEDKDLMFIEYKEEENSEEDDASSSVEEEEEDDENFEEEVKHIIKGGGKYEDIVLEIISLQKAFWEKTIYDTIKACMNVFLKDFINSNDILFNNLNTENTRLLINNIQKLILDWNALFKKIIQTPEMQIRLIALFEDICLEYNILFNFFHIFIQILNSEDIDVLSDEVLIKWSKNELSSYPTSDGEKVIEELHHKAFIQKSKKFIDSL